MMTSTLYHTLDFSLLLKKNWIWGSIRFFRIFSFAILYVLCNYFLCQWSLTKCLWPFLTTLLVLEVLMNP